MPVPKFTTAPMRVSTSAKNGAMIGLLNVVSELGVKVESGPWNVTLPLLLTNALEYPVPKKLIVNPRGVAAGVQLPGTPAPEPTHGQDPSSLPPKVIGV